MNASVEFPNSMLNAALAYAESGLAVHPLTPQGKKPLLKKWPEKATRDTETIHQWWRDHPQANIGIVTGSKSGIFVLDVDEKHNGLSELQTLTDIYGELPETPESCTGSGGRHFIFQHRDGIRNSAGKVAPGIDIRGDGGYIVAPPSIHPNGNAYEWATAPGTVDIAPAPGWLIALAEQPTQAPTVAPDGSILEGTRNSALFALACDMRRQGKRPQQVAQAITLANTTRCKPPLPQADVDGIVQRAVESAGNKSLKTLWQEYVFRTPLNATLKGILAGLSTYADADGTNCFPNMDVLAKQNDKCRRTTSKYIHEAANMGLLDIYSIPNSKTGGRSYGYILTLPHG